MRLQTRYCAAPNDRVGDSIGMRSEQYESRHAIGVVGRRFGKKTVFNEHVAEMRRFVPQARINVITQRETFARRFRSEADDLQVSELHVVPHRVNSSDHALSVGSPLSVCISVKRTQDRI